MSGVRSMLARMRRLERDQANASPIVRAFGSVEAFEARAQAGIDAGTYDPRDMTVVIASIRGWHRDEVWATWR